MKIKIIKFAKYSLLIPIVLGLCVIAICIVLILPLIALVNPDLLTVEDQDDI